MAGKRITYDISRILELTVAAALATAASIVILLLLCHDQARAAASWAPPDPWSWQDTAFTIAMLVLGGWLCAAVGVEIHLMKTNGHTERFRRWRAAWRVLRQGDRQ
jgi:hypothetical protein